MASPAPSAPETPHSSVAAKPFEPVAPPEHDAHTDPISGEAGAHPLGVGLGAASAGTAGAVIGAILGPVGAVIGAAIGAVAGGLAGKELATTETVSAEAKAQEYPLSAPADETLSEPGVNVRPGAYAGSQEQTALPPLDRLSKDVGYKDAHEAVPRSDTALPRDVVPSPYQPAEPGDGDYSRGTRGGAIPESAIMQPPVPMAGDGPSSISDLPLAVEARAPLKDSGDPLETPADAGNNASPYTISDRPIAREQSAPLKEAGDALAGATDPEAALRERAYYNYLARTQSGGGGDERSDWFSAQGNHPHE